MFTLPLFVSNRQALRCASALKAARRMVALFVKRHWKCCRRWSGRCILAHAASTSPRMSRGCTISAPTVRPPEDNDVCLPKICPALNFCLVQTLSRRKPFFDPARLTATAAPLFRRIVGMAILHRDRPPLGGNLRRLAGQKVFHRHAGAPCDMQNLLTRLAYV